MTEDDECHYCHIPLALGKRTKDHIVPRARGGLDVRWNIVMSCAMCNVRKSDNWPTCKCAKCSRTRRRHWEQLGIKESTGKKKAR